MDNNSFQYPILFIQSIKLKLIVNQFVMNLQQLSSKQDKEKEFQRGRGYAIKIFFSLFLCAGFLTYRFAYAMDLTKACLNDWLHGVLMPVNRWIDQDPTLIVILIGQLFIDWYTIGIMTITFIWCKNMRMGMFAGVFYLIRTSVVYLIKHPIPDHIVWRQPAIPNILAPYDITRDLFFSGHTGLAVLLTMEAIRFKLPKWTIYLGYTMIFWMFFMLISTHIHYTIDCIAAPFYTFFAFDIVKAMGSCPDYFFSLPYIFAKWLKESLCPTVPDNEDNRLTDEPHS